MERAHFGGWLVATCNLLPVDTGRRVARAAVRQASPDGISGDGSTVLAVAWVAEGAASHGLIIRLIIRTIRLDRTRSLWTDEASDVSRPDRLEPTRSTRSTRHGSGGQAGVLAGAAHGRPVPVGHGYAGGRLCCRLSSVAAAAVSACPAVVAGCPPCRGVRAPGVRQAASGVRASGQPVSIGCVDLAYLTSADEQAQPARRCCGAGTAAVGPPPSCRSRTPRPVSGGCGTGHRGRLGCLLLLPARSVSGRLVSAADILPDTADTAAARVSAC
jgi:hypothetical protein